MERLRRNSELFRKSNSGGQANDPNDVEEEIIETPATKRETRYHRECERYFESLLQTDADLDDIPGADPHADSEETSEPQPALQAEVLCSELQALGMAPEVTEDEFCGMLKSSGYADENGTLGFERFMVLAKDLKLIESWKATMRERNRGRNHPYRGPLGEFFEILDRGLLIGNNSGFSGDDFVDALGKLSFEITDGTVDNLVRYANLHPGVKISFKQFERVLLRARVEYYTLSR